MENSIQITFSNLSIEVNEILIALLIDKGYNGFEEDSLFLKAFIKKSIFKESELVEIVNQFNIKYVIEEIETVNWNKQWESSFQPIRINNFIEIRADFHTPSQNVNHEIIITPKMSFGTGHHATTYMMLELMREIDFKNKYVFDFGTGTGILAILAEKLGAKEIVAIDNDECCIENSKENIKSNDCSKITIQKANTPKCSKKFDIILANINKNVILENVHLLTSQLNEKGVILMSGLLESDELEITNELSKFELIVTKCTKKSNWISLVVETHTVIS